MHAGNFAILMTDVQGSTYLWSIDQEGMWEALNIHHRVITDAVERLGGQIFTTAGDSFAVAFTNPDAAVKASLDARDGLRKADWGRIGPLKVRFAVHVGYARYLQGDLIGPAVNRCARMLEVFEGDQVVASQAVRDAAEWNRYRFEYLGCHPLRDFPEGEHLYLVRWLGEQSC
jgi:class 3 adenylate cyclase